MSSLKQAPDNLTLIPLSAQWVVRVLDIAPAATARTLAISVAGVGVVYSWTNGVEVVTAPYSAAYTYDGTNLVVTLSRNAVAGQGFVMTTSYSDSLSSDSFTRSYVAGEVVLLAQSPASQAQDVSRATSVLFDAAPRVPLLLDNVTLFIDSDTAWSSYAPDGGFTRPDYSGRALYTQSLVSLNTSWRRRFNEESSVRVQVQVGVRTISSVVVYKTYDWTFTTARARTALLNTDLQRTPVDIPSGRGIIEVFRSAGIAAVRTERSTASAAVLLLYAVQHSGLSSIAPYLPGASALSAEVGTLQASDIMSPDAGYAYLQTIEPFFDVFLQELVSGGSALYEEAELLSRTWNAGTPVNRIAAVAAALLYAFPLAA